MHTREQPQAVIRNFLLRMEQFMRTHTLVTHGAHVILGVSGGNDSVAMLDAFCRLQKKWRFQLSVAHVNYGLRGAQSDADERFVRRVARAYGVSVYVQRPATKRIARAQKQSTQVAARELRYRFFAELARELGAGTIAVAHHANDNAETLAFNFFRGTGVDGLKGMAASTANAFGAQTMDAPECTVIRPLLFADRDEIERYLKARKLRHREDASNATEDYTRNFIRRRILPAVGKRINPSVVRTLNNEAAIFSSCADFIGSIVDRSAQACIKQKESALALSVKHLASEHVFIRHMLVKRCFSLLGIEPDFVHIDEIIRLLEKEPGTLIDCGGGITASRTSDAIEMGRLKMQEPFRMLMHPEEEVRTPDFTLRVEACALPGKFPAGRPMKGCVEYADASALSFPLTVRQWQAGDWFIPLGMKAKKKLSDFFTDRKIPLVRKKRIPVVLSGNDIVWVAGLRLDERFKVTSQTRSVYQLSIQFHS
ncbi:MAG: tRNA lysidine(34) synthetase TilS [Acidobacteriota bacterium]